MSITLDKNTLVLGINGSAKLKATSTIPNAEVKWSSDNKNIALSDNTGLVYAYNAGKTKIFAEVEEIKDNKVTSVHKATCDVEIFEADIYSTGFFPKMAVNQVFQLKATPTPKEVEVTITNESTNIISMELDPTGFIANVTCLKEGKGSIKLTAVYKEVTYEHIINFDIVPYFEPITELTEDILKSISIHESLNSLVSISGRSIVRKVKATDTLPTLYYVKTNSNPLVYEYSLHALTTDITKFNLATAKDISLGK